METDRQLKQFEIDNLHAIEMFRSVITTGQSALKSALLINGGAAVAMLAAISNIWTKGIDEEAATPLTASILCFAIGVLSAAIAMGVAYFTQYYYKDDKVRPGACFNVLAIILVLASYALFGIGAYAAYSAFNLHLAEVTVP